MARSLGLKVTAEGVENKSALDFIHEFGADYFQGYFLGEPVPAKEVIDSRVITRFVEDTAVNVPCV